MDNRRNTGAPQKVLEWITLFLAMLFFVLGAGILTGLIPGGRIFIQGTTKIVIGLVLIGYGVVRGGMIFRRMKSRKKGGGGE